MFQWPKHVFYINSKLFKAIVDAVIEDITCILNYTKTFLNIFAVDKRVIIGNLIFKENDHTFYYTKECKGGKRSSMTWKFVEILHSKAFFVFLVEKKIASFSITVSLLATEKLYNRFPFIILSARRMLPPSFFY